MRAPRPILVLALLLLAWETGARLSGIPAFLLPPPSRVFEALIAQHRLLAENALFTLAAMLGGLALGIALGCATAIGLSASRALRDWLFPLVLVSQTLPIFALAPLLVLWLGYGLASKIAMVALVTYFPVALAFSEGMRRTEPGLLDLARLAGAPRWRDIAHIRAPSALPALASGVRGAVVAAPLGAILGEWVGAAAGLGFLMIQANARTQTDLVFAAVLVLATLAFLLWAIIDALLRRALPWAPDSFAPR